MLWRDRRREQRRWSRELRDVPLSQLRGMVERDVFWQNPKKRRWAKRRLWWRENRGWVIVTVLTLLIGTAAMLGTYINLYLTHARP
jgi:hypothetical protein